MTRSARIISTALITAALVIAVELVVTVAWAEPVTNLQGWSAQRELERELRDLERQPQLPAEGSGLASMRAPADRLAAGAKPGMALGRIKIPALDLSVVAVEGTETEDLIKGPGHYPKTSLPGQPGTTAFAGHRTTYGAPFRFVNRLERGDEIFFEMPYATFTYRFEEQRIVTPDKVGVVRDVGYPRLVLTACHPVYSAAKRIVIFARLVAIDEGAGKANPGLDIAGIGLGPTLAALAALLVISALMYALSGRRPRRGGGTPPEPIPVPQG